MKKFSIIIALFLVSVLAIPTFADSLSDVPSDHWAYDAVNELIAAGIVEGYPDGTFKGQRNLSRYEIAMIVSRALDNIEKERAALKNEVNAIKANEDKGLNSEEAQDVAAICKAIIEKNMPAQTKVEIPEGLTEKQAAQVANLIDALTIEFETELKSLGRDVEVVEADVADLKTDVSGLKSEVAKDTVDFSGTVTTIFQIADYGDNSDATAELWADDEILDADLPTSTSGEDYDDFPAEKAFYQKIHLTPRASVKDITFDFDFWAYNSFTEPSGVEYNGQQLGEDDDYGELDIDDAVLTVNKDDYTLRIGDLDDYVGATYFIGEDDLEGAEFTGPLAGTDLRAFILGEDVDSTNDYYGVTFSKDLNPDEFGLTKIIGKVFHARLASEEVTDFAVGAESQISEGFTVGGEAVYNKVEENNTTDTLFNINADYLVNDILSVRFGYETVGEDFNSAGGVLSDLDEENNYNKLTAGADYILNANNTVTADYSKVAYDEPGNPEDMQSVEVGLANIMGDFNNNVSVEFVQNDAYQSTDDDAVIYKLGTEYAMSDVTTISANLVNKTSEEDAENLSYNYLIAGLNHKLSDNIVWDTELEYITGESDGVDGTGNALTTALSVSF